MKDGWKRFTNRFQSKETAIGRRRPTFELDTTTTSITTSAVLSEGTRVRREVKRINTMT